LTGLYFVETTHHYSFGVADGLLLVDVRLIERGEQKEPTRPRAATRARSIACRLVLDPAGCCLVLGCGHGLT
jgi:hypothetical protein